MFKKGDPTVLDNYRPIARLKALYKVYATLLRLRLEQGVGKEIGLVHYGFRAAKSTLDPIYVTRRVQDIL